MNFKLQWVRRASGRLPGWQISIRLAFQTFYGETRTRELFTCGRVLRRLHLPPLESVQRIRVGKSWEQLTSKGVECLISFGVTASRAKFIFGNFATTNPPLKFPWADIH